MRYKSVWETGSEMIICTIKRRTRRQYSTGEKIRIGLDGLRGDECIAELCRHEARDLKYGYRGKPGNRDKLIQKNIWTNLAPIIACIIYCKSGKFTVSLMATLYSVILTPHFPVISAPSHGKILSCTGLHPQRK